MNGFRPGLMLVTMLALGFALASGGCKKDTPKSTRWDTAAGSASAVTSVTITPPGMSASPAAPSGSFNRFFPKDGDGGYKRIFAADKEGYAEAKLQKDGKDVAVLSIADSQRLAYAKGKFDGATEKIEGFPLTTVGKNQSSVLVKDRFQVKVSSSTLDHEARKAILTMFDLKGLGT